MSAGLSVYIFAYYRGAVGASGGVYGLYGAFFVILLLRRQKDTARLFILLMGIDVVQSLFHPEYFSRGTLWRLCRWRTSNPADYPVREEARVLKSAAAEPAAVAQRQVLSLKNRGNPRHRHVIHSSFPHCV